MKQDFNLNSIAFYANQAGHCTKEAPDDEEERKKKRKEKKEQIKCIDEFLNK